LRKATDPSRSSRALEVAIVNFSKRYGKLLAALGHLPVMARVWEWPAVSKQAADGPSCSGILRLDQTDEHTSSHYGKNDGENLFQNLDRQTVGKPNSQRSRQHTRTHQPYEGG
jgi:hypothetical protein